MTDRKDDRIEGAPDRAHGTHGKGDARERYRSDDPVLPGNASDATTPEEEAGQGDSIGKLSGAGWGNQAAGGSVVDRRGPEKTTEKGRKRKG